MALSSCQISALLSCRLALAELQISTEWLVILYRWRRPR